MPKHGSRIVMGHSGRAISDIRVLALTVLIYSLCKYSPICAVSCSVKLFRTTRGFRCIVEELLFQLISEDSVSVYFGRSISSSFRTFARWN